MAKKAAKRRGRKAARKLTNSEKYAQRVARAMAKGKTRQQARGHKPKEHVERAVKETQRYGAPQSSARATLKRFAAKQADRMNVDRDELHAEMRSYVASYGMRRIDQAREIVRKLRKTKRQRFRRRERRGDMVIRVEMDAARSQRAYMEREAARLHLPDWRWLFYH